MAAVIKVHSEPDVVLQLVGDIHYEAGRLIVGDTDLAVKLARMAGVFSGGRRMGVLECVFTAISTPVETANQGFDGAFAETSEPGVK